VTSKNPNKLPSSAEASENRLARIDDALLCKYWVARYFDEASTPRTVLESLLSMLPHIAAESWPERFWWGGVYINGRPAGETNLPLAPPVKVEYYEPKFPISEAQKHFAQIGEPNIIYRDEDLAIVFKPPKLPTLPAKEQRHFSLKSQLERLLGKTCHIPSRLDFSVCGLVPISISSRGNRGLQNAFQGRRAGKYYRLMSHVTSEWENLTCDGAIAIDPLHAVLRTVRSDGLPSITTFRRLQPETSQLNFALYEAKPLTGRTHQIRVHSASLGIPIVGDSFYNGAEHPELHLCCVRLEIEHPVSGLPLAFDAPERLVPKWCIR
jgi:tRNA pseudouridine32 synthase / 23S rRNA pseudouridine746 synthase